MWRPPAQASTSIDTFLTAFPTDDDCEAYLFYHSRGLWPVCPFCGEPARWKAMVHRRSHISSCCCYIANSTAQTVFERTKLSLRSWFYGMLLFSSMPGGVSVGFLSRQLGISHKAAWLLCDKIRHHMAALEKPRRIGGDGVQVWADETLIRISGQRDPTCIFGLTDGPNVSLTVVSDRRAATLMTLIERHVAPGSLLITDDYHSYRRLPERGWSHRRVNHSTGMWTNDAGDTSAPIESVWKAMKRELRGRTGQIAQPDLWKFLKQFLCRYHGRLAPDEAFWKLVSTFPPRERYDPQVLRSEVDIT